MPHNFFDNIPYDILNDLSFYINNKNKIKLDISSKYIKELTYIYIIKSEENQKLNDNILKQKNLAN